MCFSGPSDRLLFCRCDVSAARGSVSSHFLMLQLLFSPVVIRPNTSTIHLFCNIGDGGLWTPGVQRFLTRPSVAGQQLRHSELFTAAGVTVEHLTVFVYRLPHSVCHRSMKTSACG